jgi:hypothetical protein
VRTLTASDITAIPPGTATGTLYSGDYVITAAAIEACQCRVGSCTGIHLTTGGVNSVTETDGAIRIGSSNGGVCSGGVNCDGRFSCDGGQAGNVGYFLESGQFLAANGAPTSMEVELLNTFSNTQYDCDLRARFTAQYSGSPTGFAMGISAAVPNTEGGGQRLGLLGVVGSQ